MNTLPKLMSLVAISGLLVLVEGRSLAQESGSAPTSASESEDAVEADANTEETSEEERETAEEAESREDKGTLADRIKSVQRKTFVKKGRFELSPQFGLSLNDSFFTHISLGAGAAYHVADSFALELRGGGVIASPESSALRFVREETDSLIEDPPAFKYYGDANGVWAPVYGKFSLFGESIIHFDGYVTLGFGVFGTDSGAHPAANVGVGSRFFLTDWLAARVELRDHVFLENRNGESDLQHLLSVNLGVSFFLPTSFDSTL
jgi:outer membrane beta-barrel protein